CISFDPPQIDHASTFIISFTLFTCLTRGRLGCYSPNHGGTMTRLSLQVTLTVLFVALLAIAQQRSVQRPDGSHIPPSQIDATVNRLMEAAHVTGVGIALFHRGQVAYLKTYGLRDVEKGLPLTPNSVMTSASFSKASFATVV